MKKRDQHITVSVTTHRDQASISIKMEVMHTIAAVKLILLKSDFNAFKEALDDYDIKEVDNFGNNILHYYIKESKNLTLDHKELIELVLGKGLDINTKQTKGTFKRSALQLAVFMKLKDITDHLIKLGADVNSTDANGNSVLWTAVMFYRDQDGYFIEKLIESGADVHQKNDHGKSPIQIAYAADNNDAKKFFIVS